MAILKIKIEQFRHFLSLSLEIWVFLAITILLIVWALPHTIAARNISLFTGVAAGLVWIYLERPAIQLRNYLPSIFLLCVPLWMIIHYHFTSTLKEQQWDEIDSTWLRTTFSIILGFFAGLVLQKHPRYFLFFLIGIITLPLMTAAYYFLEVYHQNKWVLDNFLGPFKGKFSGVYFVTCQILLGFACLSMAFFSPIHSTRLKFGFSILGSFLILIGIFDGIAFRALNLILIAGFSTLIFSILFFMRLISQFVQKNIKLLPIIFFGVILSSLIATLYSFYIHDKHHEQKLSNLISDIKISTQLEKNQTWIRDGRPISDPIDANGRPINGSTYERTSWFIRGVKFIIENPLGNGITHQSFGYYMRDIYPNSKALMTHSAWVDYTLGVGLPGLFLTWLAIVGCTVSCLHFIKKTNISRTVNQDSREPLRLNLDNFYHKLIDTSLISFCGIWLILGLAFYWIVGEVSEREYLEHYFFLIALIATVTQINTENIIIKTKNGSNKVIYNEI